MSWLKDKVKKATGWKGGGTTGDFTNIFQDMYGAVEKPGGDIKKQITDPVRNWSKKLEHHVWGNKYPGRSSSSSDDSNQEELAALNRSRKTRLGPGREGQDKDSDERRGLSNMSMGTLLTQGQKAKKLPTA